ncbi:hypothetical protein GPL15_26745 [Clostridium sp. MCC353]|uniref:tripartite tricarboxylate transporter substrate binding protein n=1 Tax=Clostridium sp. MCC353 TaxID=2592646 RepID=UPI001C019C84|nr:tripartite tricarboxylate transporter substrate binding protein [Clostridium sp. MCC353]MBT9780070.1 hypothetical protein [Clostridium sp. MCC353]
MDQYRVKKIIFSFMILITISIGMTACQKSGASKSESGGQQKGASTDYPSKSVQVIINKKPGGGSDVVGRMVAAALEKKLGQPFVVLNKEGGDGIIGTNEAAKAEPDGYTLNITAGPEIAYSIVNGENVEFDENSFDYVAGVNVRGNILAMKKDSQFKSLDELIAYAKENPGKITIGFPGGGGKAVAVEFMESLGVEFTIINAGNGNDLYSKLLGNHIDCGLIGSQFYQKFMDEGCGVFVQTVEDPSEGIEGLPTMKEKGYDMVYDVRVLLAVPKGTPQEIIGILDDALKESFEESLKDELIKSGENAKYIDGQELTDYMKAYYEKAIPTMKRIKEQYK